MANHIIYDGLLHFFNKILHFNAFSLTLFSVILIFLQSMYINFIVVKYKLLPKITYFPALAYLLITSINPAFNYFSELLLINWLMIMAIDILLSFSQTLNPRKQIFNAGFIVCLPLLIQPTAIGFVLVLMIALLLLRPFHIAEWAVAFLGYMMPIYFFVALLFLFDNISLLKQLPEVNLLQFKSLAHPVYLMSCLVGIVILVACGVIGIQQQVTKMTISVRRAWIFIFLYLLISVLIAFISSSNINAQWALLMPPLAIIISHAFYIEKTKRFSNFILYFSLVFVIFCQLAINK